MAALALQGVSKVFAGPVTGRPGSGSGDTRSGAGRAGRAQRVRQDDDAATHRRAGRSRSRRDPVRWPAWSIDRPPRDRNVAMVFQHGVLYPHLTVYENMAVGLRWRYGGGWIRRCWMRWRHPAEAQRQAERRRAIARQVQDAARDPRRRAPAGSDAPAIVRGRMPASRFGKSHRPPTGGVFVGRTFVASRRAIASRDAAGIEAIAPARARHHGVRHARPGGGLGAG